MAEKKNKGLYGIGDDSGDRDIMYTVESVSLGASSCALVFTLVSLSSV